MPRDEQQELRDALTATRQALKGLQRQARATLQLATDLEERLAKHERSQQKPQPKEAQDNGNTVTQADDQFRRLAAAR